MVVPGRAGTINSSTKEKTLTNLGDDWLVGWKLNAAGYAHDTRRNKASRIRSTMDGDIKTTLYLY